MRGNNRPAQLCIIKLLGFGEAERPEGNELWCRGDTGSPNTKSDFSLTARGEGTTS